MVDLGVELESVIDGVMIASLPAMVRTVGKLVMSLLVCA